VPASDTGETVCSSDSHNIICRHIDDGSLIHHPAFNYPCVHQAAEPLARPGVDLVVPHVHGILAHENSPAVDATREFGVPKYSQGRSTLRVVPTPAFAARLALSTGEHSLGTRHR